MSDQLKVFRYLAAAAAADGVIDRLEQELLLAGAQELGVPPTEVAPILEEALADKRLRNLPPLAPSEDDATLAKVCEILMADGVMQRAEQRFLDRLQLVFSLDRITVDRAVDRSRKRLSVLERTQSGRIKRRGADERARPVAKDGEFVYTWKGGRAALGRDRLLVLGPGGDREIPFEKVQAVHLEVDEATCCVSLDVAGERPVTITEEGSGGGEARWTYTAFLTHLHDRLRRHPRGGTIAFMTGDSKRYKRLLGYLAIDILVGGFLLYGLWFVVSFAEGPVEARFWLALGSAALAVVIGWHLLALRSQRVATYVPDALPSGFLPGSRFETDKVLVLTSLLALLVALSEGD